MPPDRLPGMTPPGPTRLSTRERLDLLFDPPGFHETFQFARHAALLPGRVPPLEVADLLVSGRGLVAGRPAYASSHEGRYLEGTQGWIQARAICGIMDLALKARAPFVWISGAGAPDRAALGTVLRDYARVFHYNALLAGVVPQIAVVVGPGDGTGFVPSLTDFVVASAGARRVRLAGAEILENDGPAGTQGPEIRDEDVHVLAADEAEAVLAARRLLSYIPAADGTGGRAAEAETSPALPDDGLLGRLRPARERYDMMDVLRRIADADSLFEVHRHYAPNIIAAFVRFDGRPAAVVANQPLVGDGAITPEAADKASRFVQFCNAFGIPLVSVVDVPGFGGRPAAGGAQDVTRHAARMLFAFSAASVPKITVIVGRAQGGAYLAMGAKSLGADRVAAWPGAEITIVPHDRDLGGLLRRESAGADGAPQGRATPYTAAAAGVVDAVIEPARTRAYILAALEALRGTRPGSVHAIRALPSRTMFAGRAAAVPTF